MQFSIVGNTQTPWREECVIFTDASWELPGQPLQYQYPFANKNASSVEEAFCKMQ
jgi:hypothetical protein